MSAGSAEIGAGGCRNTLLRAHSPASASFVSTGTVFSNSTNAVAVPCSTNEVTFSAVPFANEPFGRRLKLYH